MDVSRVAIDKHGRQAIFADSDRSVGSNFARHEYEARGLYQPDVLSWMQHVFYLSSKNSELSAITFKGLSRIT